MTVDLNDKSFNDDTVRLIAIADKTREKESDKGVFIIGDLNTVFATVVVPLESMARVIAARKAGKMET